MQKLTEVLGEYGLYVWPAFLVAGLSMGWIAAVSLRALARAMQTAAELQGPDEA